jgi:hypothetical protein
MKIKTLVATTILIASMSSHAIDLTLSPIFTVTEAVRSAVGSALLPYVATSVSFKGTFAKLMQAVRNDALSFLAEGEKTDRLESSFVELRKVEGLENQSDEQLSKLIILSIE